MNSIIRLVGAVSLVAAVTGCASTSNPHDPFEGFNRTMFSFNDTFDKVALKPAATVYQSVLPSFVQTGIGNFFGNIADIWTAVNNLLQGKGEAGTSDIMRVAINSTFGLAGILDIASEAHLQKHKEDFGQTLGKWGISSGPYVVLPLLGPSTLRDTIALPVDIKGDLWSHVDPVRVRNVGIVVRVVDERAAALNASNLVEEAALDPYEFVRDAYLQRRESTINDGETSKSLLKPNGSMLQPKPGDSSLNEAPGTPIDGGVQSALAVTPEPNAQPVVQLEQSIDNIANNVVNATITVAKEQDVTDSVSDSGRPVAQVLSSELVSGQLTASVK